MTFTKDLGETAWKAGDQLLWTYENPNHPGLVDQRPVTVITDDDRHLAIWLGPGTRMLYQVLADGRDLRDQEGTERFTAPRAQAVRQWVGAGIVAVFLPGATYSVWFFESGSGRRDAYYINIEAPYRRSVRGITSSDFVLDIVADAEGTFRYKDEDELDLALQSGQFTQSDVNRIHAAAEDAVRRIENWRFPFGSGYEDFVPDPAWEIPQLPSDATWTFET